MNDVTRVLSANEHGDPAATEELLPLVYEELRKLAAVRLANEPPGLTLQPTALVHEAYLRLVDEDQSWETRGHFFAAAAESMRRILVERARRKLRAKHGGNRQRVDLVDCLTDEAPSQQLLALHEALDRFCEEDPAKGALAKLRYFAGMSIEEAAQALGVSRATACRHWAYAKAWQYCAMEDAGDLQSSSLSYISCSVLSE